MLGLVNRYYYKKGLGEREGEKKREKGGRKEGGEDKGRSLLRKYIVDRVSLFIY